MTEVLYAVEGVTDVPVAEKLIRLVGRVPRLGPVPSGKSQIDKNLDRWNQSSNRQPFLVIRDWDTNDKVECVPALLTKLLTRDLEAPGFAFRIAVRAIESWLMADADSFAEFFVARKSRLPIDPDSLQNPKLALVTVCSRSPARIRTGMLPRPGSGRVVGPEYASLVVEFGRSHWDPERASLRSPSLNRTIGSLRSLVASGAW